MESGRAKNAEIFDIASSVLTLTKPATNSIPKTNQGAAAAHRAQEDPLLQRRVRRHREALGQQRHQAREVRLRRLPVRQGGQVRRLGVPQVRHITYQINF